MSYRTHLEILDTETLAVTTLATFDHVIEAPNWTLDGKSLVYNAMGRLYVHDLEGGHARPLDTGFAQRCNNDHVLSPDGRQIAISHSPEDGMSRIYTLPLSGGNPTLITPMGPSYLHGWSPDGQTLAYCAKRGEHYDVFTIPAIGGEEMRLTDSGGVDDGPEYTPDGAYIWFNSARSGRMQLYRMRPDGTAVERMTHDERNNWFAHISPDGERVVYISYESEGIDPLTHLPGKHVELRMMSSNGGAPQTLLSLYGGQGTMNVNAWAPDSRRLAFVRFEDWG